MKNILITKVLFCFALVFFIGSASAQSGDEPSESIGESWTGVGLNYKPNKSLTLGIEEQLRLKSKDKLYKSSFTELNASYKLLQGLKAGIGYRYINSYDDQGKKQGSETHHRMHYRLAYKTDINDFDLGFRLQYQRKTEQSSEDIIPNERWRVKTDMEYNIGNWKLDPKLSFELLYDLDEDPDDRENKYRISIGSSYKINSAMKLDFRYMYENGLSTPLSTIPHVLRLNFTYTIKKNNKIEEPELKLDNANETSK